MNRRGRFYWMVEARRIGRPMRRITLGAVALIWLAASATVSGGSPFEVQAALHR